MKIGYYANMLLLLRRNFLYNHGYILYEVLRWDY